MRHAYHKIRSFFRKVCGRNRIGGQTSNPLHVPTPEEMRRAPNFNQVVEEEMVEKTFESEVMGALKAQSDLLNTMSNSIASIPNLLTTLNDTISKLPTSTGTAGGPAIADVLTAVSGVSDQVKAVADAVASEAADIKKTLAEITPAPDNSGSGP